MKITIVGLRDMYIPRMQSDMTVCGAHMGVTPHVLDMSAKDNRHTVTIEAPDITLLMADETPAADRCAIIKIGGHTLTLWAEAFYSLYIR